MPPAPTTTTPTLIPTPPPPQPIHNLTNGTQTSKKRKRQDGTLLLMTCRFFSYGSVTHVVLSCFVEHSSASTEIQQRYQQMYQLLLQMHSIQEQLLEAMEVERKLCQSYGEQLKKESEQFQHAISLSASMIKRVLVLL
jgi:hypothetical protein